MNDLSKFKNWLIINKDLTIFEAENIINDLFYSVIPEENNIKLQKEYGKFLANKKTEKITLRIEPEIKKQLEEIAKDNKMKLGEVIRPTIYEFIDNYQKFERRLQNEERKREKVRGQRSI